MTAERYAPRGVALVQRLLTDGDSPLYTPYPAGELELAVRHANTALLPALMDVVAIILGLVSFVILLAFIEGLERV